MNRTKKSVFHTLQAAFTPCSTCINCIWAVLQYPNEFTFVTALFNDWSVPHKLTLAVVFSSAFSGFFLLPYLGAHLRTLDHVFDGVPKQQSSPDKERNAEPRPHDHPGKRKHEKR